LSGTTVFGYLALVAKSTAKGQTPPDPTKPETWVKAMMQGGGLGIYGDFIFGEFNKYGQSPVGTLAGPVFGEVENLLRTYSKVKDAETIEDAKSEMKAYLARTVINNTPFQNIFYARAVLDYLFLHQLQESVNPGYLSRLEERIMSETGQEFYLPPTQRIPYGGGDELFEGVGQ
jgi:hypothetical protein